MALPITRKAFIVGTAGHVDHGKTSLVRALTGVNTDRWREEQERGLTIDIGFARLPAEEGLEVGVIDVPGHEDFVKNMLAGATGIDLLLLVIAADEGPMPQTREHLAIARLLGVRTGVVALTKIDRVDEEWRALAAETVREELERQIGHARWPIIPVSAPNGTGIEALREAVLSTLRTGRPRAEEDVFRMPVDRCFTLPGAGTVVTGTVWSGCVRRGDTLRILPGGHSARVRSLQVHGESRDGVGAGRRCAMSLVGIEPAQAGRGATVTSHPGWQPVSRLGARIELLSDCARPLRDGQRIRLYLGTHEVLARVRLPDSQLGPGAESWAALDLDSPLLARVGDRFVVRFLSPVTTIGGGRVAELEPPRRWVNRTSEWETVIDGTHAESLAAAVRLSGRSGLERGLMPLASRDGAASRGGEDPGRLPSGVIECGRRLFSSQTLAEAREWIISELERMHGARRRSAAESLESLRAAVGARFHPRLIEHILTELESEGALIVEGPEVRLPGHEAALTADETRAMEEVLERIRRGEIDPPGIEEIRTDLGLEHDLMQDLLRLLTARRLIVPVSSDFCLSIDSERNLRVLARRVLKKEGNADPASFKGELRVSRKYLIPLLEYLDRVGMTRRVGDGRELVERE